MKLIHALKLIKSLTEKEADLRAKVAKICSHLDYETPVYPNPQAKVAEWIQVHHDVVMEIEKLRVAVQHTNLVTGVASA